MTESLLRCPSCNSDKVTLEYQQKVMANTWEHYCHSMKPQDSDSPAGCLECDWTGQHKDLNGGKA
jgi:hypothetical protein